jgi:hypothetical protein
VKFNVATGVIDPDTTPFYQSKKNNFQPRVGATYALKSKTVLKGGFGIFVGPGQTEDQISRSRPNASTRRRRAARSWPSRLTRRRFAPTSSTTRTTGRSSRAPTRTTTRCREGLPVHASLQQEMGGGFAASAAYVGSQGRNLFLRSVTNQTIGVQSNGASAGTQVREFDIVTCATGAVRTGSMCVDAGGIASIQRPYAEIDYKTSGGHDSYNAMQLALTKRSNRGCGERPVHLRFSKGNTGGSNEAATAGNNASFSAERPANRTNLTDFSYETASTLSTCATRST